MTVRAVAFRLVEAIEGEVVAVDDGRVWRVERALSAVERALSACRWRGLTLAGVAGQAAAALECWDASCRRLEIELARLLDSSSWRTDHPFRMILKRLFHATMARASREPGASRCR